MISKSFNSNCLIINYWKLFFFFTNQNEKLLQQIHLCIHWMPSKNQGAQNVYAKNQYAVVRLKSISHAVRPWGGPSASQPFTITDRMKTVARFSPCSLTIVYWMIIDISYTPSRHSNPRLMAEPLAKFDEKVT